LKSFVIFVSFKVNCVARECALGHVVRNPGESTVYSAGYIDSIGAGKINVIFNE